MTTKAHLPSPLITQYPLITYEFAFNQGTNIVRAFHKADIPPPNAALSVADNDVLKTYVKLGLGIGIMAKAAYEPKTDSDLTLIDISQLIEPCYSGLLFRPDSYLRGYIYDFIGLFNPSLTKERLDQLLYAPVIEDFSI